MKILALPKEYCSDYLFEDNYCNGDLTRNSVLVYPNGWRNRISRNYINVADAICKIAYYWTSCKNVDEYEIRCKDIISNTFSCDEELKHSNYARITELIVTSLQHDYIYIDGFHGTCFSTSNDIEQEIICKFLNQVFPGSLWEMHSITGCCQGDYAEILVNNKRDDIQYFVDCVECDFFRTGDSYDIFVVDDLDVINLNVTELIKARDYYDRYGICIPWSTDKKSAIAKYTGYNRDDIYFVEKKTQTIVNYYIV